MKLEELISEAAEIEGAPEWTLTEAVRNPEIAWEIINLLIRDDKFITEIVGKSKDKFRTNVSTIKEMSALRKKIVKYADGDYADDYKAFYKELRDVLDTYAAKVLLDMYKEDETVIQKASELKVVKKKATAARLEKARAARS